MESRWNRYFERQQQDPEIKDLVEQELATLRLGTTIVRMRERHHLTQTQLAARAGMSTSKISAIETGPKNVELATLIRIATALGYQFRPEFVPANGRKRAQSATARNSRTIRSRERALCIFAGGLLTSVQVGHRHPQNGRHI
jgi:transcriptional regulator with XRE-family HTH domain